MNCNDFHERLQRRLDERVRPEADRDLVRHAQRCESCRGQLETWQRLSVLMPQSAEAVEPRRPAHSLSRPRIRWAVSGLAVAAILVIAVPRDQDPSSTSPSGPAESLTIRDRVSHPSEILAHSDVHADPSDWWQEVQRRDWVGRTMPTVRSMQRGVAPLGRTLMRAVTILTIGGHDQTS